MRYYRSLIFLTISSAVSLYISLSSLTTNMPVTLTLSALDIIKILFVLSLVSIFSACLALILSYHQFLSDLTISCEDIASALSTED